MERVHNFYNWFQNIGGDVNNINYDNLFDTLNETILKVSSFKNRADEIKQKYNHKFVFTKKVINLPKITILNTTFNMKKNNKIEVLIQLLYSIGIPFLLALLHVFLTSGN